MYADHVRFHGWCGSLISTSPYNLIEKHLLIVAILPTRVPSLLGSSLKVPKRNDLAVPIQHVEDTDVVVFSPLFLTLGVHVQRGLRYLVCVSVCLCVCLRLFSHCRQGSGL